jgi:hypothetical protein
VWDPAAFNVTDTKRAETVKQVAGD